MNTYFENKKEYRYLKFDKRNKLIESGIIDDLVVDESNKFWRSFGSNEQIYDVQGQRLGNMIIFSLKDSSKFIVYLNDIPEEYREYKFKINKCYTDGDQTFECFDIFINSGRKFACFVNLQIPDDYIIGKVKQINNAEICEIKRNPYSTYKTILHSKDESNY